MKNSEMPAMPQTGSEGASGDLNSSADWGGTGLTKREQVVKDFMCAMLSGKNRDMYPEDLAKEASVYADAYFKELEK